jgi:hypothetical protein
MEKKARELFLEVNNKKSVQLIYEKDFLTKIVISVKKFKELLGNRVIDKESIYDIERIILIMPSSKQNEIPIENGRKYLSDNPAENDPNQTGKFVFYVLEGFQINDRALNVQKKR